MRNSWLRSGLLLLGCLTASVNLSCAPPLRGGEYDDLDGGVGDDGGGGPSGRCPDTACPTDSLCIDGACVPTTGPCASDDECQNDSYCEKTRCIPYGPGRKTSDPECKGGGFMAEKFEAPTMKCQWTAAAVIMAPVVADLDGDKLPEIIFVRFDNGGLVALRGKDCTEVFQSAAGLGTRSQLAVADLDGDAVPEIVGISTTGQVKVFNNRGVLVATASAASPSGPSGFKDGGAAIANLDGVGPPEIVYAGSALRLEAGRLTTLWSVSVDGGHWGILSAVADVDLDGKPDVVTGNRILEGMTGADKTPPSVRSFGPGYVAIAQFDPATPEPEIVLISSAAGQQGTLRVFHPKTGNVVLGPYAFGQQWGGPPTVADFDGDGKPEVAAAGYQGYAVFDPDCAVSPVPAFCQGPGLRWLKTTRDFSSGSTGSSVFDFNGDGQAEVVYRDECWLRVYDGKTGQVRFAQSLTSGTIIELPVIADVDNDGHADLVVPTHNIGACEAEPELHIPAGPGTQGIQVLVDPKNRWMPSRAIWNQHTYHITNINDDATVPLVEANNWLTWNNYRQNVQGIIKSEAPAPDLTGGSAQLPDGPNCASAWVLHASLCNRGASTAAAGIPGTFYVGDPRMAGKKICTAVSTKALAPGQCEVLSCEYKNPPGGPVDLWFRADDDGSSGREIECKEKNNLLHTPNASCMVIG